MKKILAILFCAAAAPVFCAERDEIDMGVLLDPQEAILLGRSEDFCEVLSRDIKYAEGPVWREKTGEVFFVETSKNAIFRWTPDGGKTLFMRPAGMSNGIPEKRTTVGPNGLALDLDGSLVICDQGNRCVKKLNEKNFTSRVLAREYMGKRLNEPNDVCVAPNGDIFFTDPALWCRRGFEPQEGDLDFNGLYRLTPSGELFLIDILRLPNGVAVGADSKTVYVGQSRGDDPCLIAYTISDDGKTYSSKKIFCNFRIWEKAKIIGTPDGLSVDSNGYIYACANGGLHIFSPKLEHLGYVQFENFVSNCCVIYKDSKPDKLFITGSGAIYLADIPKILKAASEGGTHGE